MKFRTEIEREPLLQPIDCRDKVLFVGSCFSDHIGSWLESHWLNVLSNPWGVLFNPASIAQSLQRIQEICKNGYSDLGSDNNEKKTAQTFELHEQNGTFYSFDHHGKWSGKNADELQQALVNLDKTVSTTSPFSSSTYSAGYLYTFGNRFSSTRVSSLISQLSSIRILSAHTYHFISSSPSDSAGPMLTSR